MDNIFLALRVVVSLAAVLGVIWFAQRRLTKGKLLQKVVREIRVVGRQSLGSKASVVLIEADGKRMMLGVTDHSITLLDSSPAKTDPAVQPQPASTQPAQTQPAQTQAVPTQAAPAVAATQPESRPAQQPTQEQPSADTADFAALLAPSENSPWPDMGPTAWKRPRATLRRGTHR